MIFPHIPQNEPTEEQYFYAETDELKYISDYTGLNFNEVLELDCYTYKVLLSDAYIYKMSQTKEGREYLQECYILQQTEPDRKALRENFGGGSL